MLIKFIHSIKERALPSLFVSPPDKKPPSSKARWLNIALVAAFIIGIGWFAVARLNYHFDWEVLWRFRIKILRGYSMTFVITIISLVLSLFIGTLSALGLEGRVLFFKYLARAYVEGIRSTPFLVQINFFYFIIATALGMNNKYLLGILILSIFTGAYVTEIIRGGLQSIPESQWMTIRSLSFTKSQAYRFIIFPQVFRRILPALAGQLSSLVKDSSLLSVIAVSELTKSVLEADAITFRTFENLTFLAVGYMVITIPISLISKYLERKFYYES